MDWLWFYKTYRILQQKILIETKRTIQGVRIQGIRTIYRSSLSFYILQQKNRNGN